MKKTIGLTLTALVLSFMFIEGANANEVEEAVGAFAVVNPETGVVHGVITGSIEYFGSNDKTMGHEYMGCPVGCLIVQQSTADQNGNVSGIRSQENKEVIHVQERNVFQIYEHNTLQSETIVESASNTLAIETEVGVSRSVRVYEFGVQDLTNANDTFQINEIAPPQNTSAEVYATTKEFVCEESNFLCSSMKSSSSNTLVDESVLFNERSTTTQIETKIITEAKNKIREQLSLILSMLERWILN